METRRNILMLIGRICFSLPFIVSGVQKILHFSQFTTAIHASGFTQANWLIIAAILIELVGGLMLLVGWQTLFAGFLLSIFILVVSFTLHPFWNYHGAMLYNQLLHFLKNIGLLGATFYFMAEGAGRYSLDGR